MRELADASLAYSSVISWEESGPGLDGFLGLAPEVRPGYQNVRVTCHLDSDAAEDRVAALWEHVQKTSPVLDILRRPVSVTTTRV